MKAIDRLRAALLGAVLGLPLTMCGGAATMPASSPSPADEVPAGTGTQAAPSTKMESQPGYPPPPPAQPSVPGSADADVSRRREAAIAELGRAQHDLEAAAGDCSVACRALASMERATQHLCDLAVDADDQGRCGDARQRLLAARQRVRSACGTCP
jgi:hypothetical protein